MKKKVSYLKMGPARRVKPDEENQLPPPTTIEELWVRMNIMEKELKREIREEGTPFFGNLAQACKDVYTWYRKSD